MGGRRAAIHDATLLGAKNVIVDHCSLSWALSPNNAADANADRDDDGYTNLEEYLNGIDPRRPKRD